MFVRGGGITPATPKLGHVSTSQPSLWSGRRGTLGNPLHCDLPLLNGFLPYRSSCGTCQLRGASPNIWFAAVATLEFRITLICFPEGPFIGLFTAVCPRASVLVTHPCWCNMLPDIIFLDLLLLPPVSCLTHTYWSAYTTPHIFFLWAGDTDSGALCGWGLSPQAAPLPPSGWSACLVTLTHCAVGGGTSGRWQLVVWYPLSRAAPAPAHLDPLPWFPIRTSVEDRVATVPVLGGHAPANSLPVAAVVRLQDAALRLHRGTSAPTGASVVHQWGLFPVSDHSTPVLLSAVGSVLGMGVCPLTWPELAVLWDVLILVLDWLSADTDLKLLRGFCASAPAKILFVGADALLTTLFRGGFQEFPEEERVGPAPKTDDDLGLAVGVGDTPPSLAMQVQVIKGDTQKVDSTNVPDHLWVYAFLCSYGPEAHGPRHLQALGLPPMA
jgi:hypothetical protein